MKKIIINSDNRRFNISSIVVGYLEENKEEVLEFEIPEKYSEYGKKACFSANGQTFAKTFDDIISNKLTITRDISQFKELDMTIAFFKTENEDEIVARTSILKIYIENAIICDDDISPDEPKIIILDKLIDEVTKVGLEVEKKGDYANLQGNYAKEQGDYAKSQGDYAKEQKIEVVKANEEANRIINNFETNVGEYTTSFNENANNKTTDFDSNAESKTSDFNQNVDNKISEYNNNASEKLSAYNTNATSKLNDYNTNASAKLQEYNDNATQKIEEYDAHSQELDNKIVSTRNELERVKNDILETGSASDSFINIQDSAWAELQKLEIEGVCQQETTTGRNLLPSGVSTSITKSGVTFSCDGNGNYTLKGTNSDTKNVDLYINLVKPMKLPTDKNLYLHMRNNVATGNSGMLFAYQGSNFYVPNFNDVNRITTSTKLNCGEPLNIIGATVQAGKTVSITFTPSIELTPNVTDYEPYTGGQPSPSPDYPQEIRTITGNLKLTSSNKNLIPNYDFEVNNMYGLNVIAKNNKLSIKGLIPKINYSSIILFADGSYEIGQWRGTKETIKKQKGFFGNNKLEKMLSLFLKGNITSSKFRLILGYETYTDFVSYTIISNKEKLIDTKEKLNYICFGFLPEDTIDIEISLQLEQSSTATSFVEHLESMVNINLPEGEFIGKFSDTNKDYVSLEYNKEDGQYHAIVNKYIGKGVLNGTEPGWGASGTTVSNKNRFANSSMSSLMVAPAKDNEIANIISNKLVSKSAYNTYDNVNGISVNTQGTIYIYYDDIANYTTAEFKNWLSANQNEFYYLLATPYKIDLGPVDMPLSYNEVTNIFTDSDLLPKINAKYYRNFVTTIQNLQVNEKELKQELVDINTRLSALENANTSAVDNNPTEESEVTE